MVHCTAAGAVPELFKVMFKFTVVPGVADPDERLRVTPCEKPKQEDSTANTMTRNKISRAEDLAERHRSVQQSPLLRQSLVL